jgi:uncharacterized membrane protein (DUF485 family)
MNKTSFKFLTSLSLVAVYISAAIGVAFISEFIVTDFIHHNPSRPQSNAIFMMEVYIPIICLIAFIGTFLVFTVPQYLHGSLTGILLSKYGSKGFLFAIAAIPLAALLAWYGYDYLTPTDFGLGISFGPDWVPYKHGVTLERYFKTLLFQVPISLFSLLRLWLEEKGKMGFCRYLFFVLLAIAVVVGVPWGHHMAMNQLRLAWIRH